MRSIGMPELIIIFGLLFLLVCLPFYKIFSKAGYPGFLGFGMFVPVLNIILVLFLAFGDWPVLQELRSLRQRTPVA